MRGQAEVPGRPGDFAENMASISPLMTVVDCGVDDRHDRV
jgi:hypothetical protein